MGNHGIVEPASWDDTTPQVPDPGPTSYMDTAAATIEAFITILGKRTRFLKAKEEADHAAQEIRINNVVKQMHRSLEMQAGQNWARLQTIAGFNPQFMRSHKNVADPHTGGAGGKFYRFVTADKIPSQIAAASGFVGTFNDCTTGFGAGDHIVAVGSGGVIQYETNHAGSFVQSRSGGGDLYTVDTDFHQATNTGTGARWIFGGANGILAYGAAHTDTSWTPCVHPFGTASIVAVRYLNGLWIATSSDGKLATSPNGITFTLRLTAGSSEFCRHQIFWHNALQMWCAIGRVLSPGYDCFWATSSNGTTWTQNSSGFFSSHEVSPLGPQFTPLTESLAVCYWNAGDKNLLTMLQWTFADVPRGQGFNATSYTGPFLRGPGANIVKYYITTIPNTLGMALVLYDGTDSYLYMSPETSFNFLNP